jgi:hypothetical protein
MVLTTVGIMLPCATDIQRLRQTRSGTCLHNALTFAHLLISKKTVAGIGNGQVI